MTAASAAKPQAMHEIALRKQRKLHGAAFITDVATSIGGPVLIVDSDGAISVIGPAVKH
jgi:hypothetical protein